MVQGRAEGGKRWWQLFDKCAVASTMPTTTRRFCLYMVGAEFPVSHQPNRPSSSSVSTDVVFLGLISGPVLLPHWVLAIQELGGLFCKS